MSVKNTQFRTRGGFEGEDVTGKSGQAWSTQQLGETLVPFDGHTATGGSIVDDGDYRYHHFPFSSGASQTFQVTVVSSLYPGCEYFVVGGGGAGGSGGGSGGGAGGMVTGPAPITATTYPITVGSGGARSPVSDGNCGAGSNGDDSAFNHPGLNDDQKVGSGGGRGGFRGCSASAGNSGGSGGAGYTGPGSGGYGDGGKWSPTSPLTPGNAPGQGYPGGDAGGAPNYCGGGGGGYSGAGADCQGSGPSGNGGAGVQAPPGFRVPTITFGIGPSGPQHWVCGGGGGGGEATNRDCGMGGAAPETLMSGDPNGFYGWSGGGPGAQPNQPNPNPYGTGYGHPGQDGTGGGGGGADRSNGRGGPGGNGVVIIRYRYKTS